MAGSQSGSQPGSKPVKDDHEQPLSLAIEGVIGVGKTTLARALSERLGALRLCEDDLNNPYLERFYGQRARWALPCQLWYLEARLRQFAEPRPRGLPVVADHSMVKEAVFAAVNLSGEELALYRRYHDLLAPGCCFAAQVTIFLSAGVQELRDRICRRGRDAEGQLGLDYLDALDRAYQGWLAEVGRERVVVVANDATNIAADPGAVDRLLDACVAAPHGLSYCNPVG